jgi:hypothetical protein
MKPPTDLVVTVTEARADLSFTPPTPAPEGYRLLAGPTVDDLQLVTGSVTAATSLDLNAMPAVWPRGTPFLVALQSSRKLGMEYSAASVPVAVTMPLLAPATLQVDCTVAHVNEGPYLTDRAFAGVYESGGCVTGTYRSRVMESAFDRTYGSTYALPGVGRVLDLGLVDSVRTEDPMDGPYPAMWFQLSPLSSVESGTAWTTWVGKVGPGEPKVFGGIFQLSDWYQWGTRCLWGLASAGSLTVTSASGLDQPGQGSFRIQGAVTFVDPFTVPGLCAEVCCR